jgi:sodium-dependent dicarboxylate transporter 2/3/5
VLLLFGGGLALAKSIEVTGFDTYLAGMGGVLEGWPLPLMIVFVAVTAAFLSEVTSNTAQTAIMLPVGAALAEKLNIGAGLVLVPGVLGACLAFMLPGGTPPNAIVFSSRMVTIRQMAWAGVWINLACAGVVVALVLGLRALGWLPGMEWGLGK